MVPLAFRTFVLAPPAGRRAGQGRQAVGANCEKDTAVTAGRHTRHAFRSLHNNIHPASGKWSGHSNAGNE